MVILDDKYKEKPYLLTGPLTASSTERVRFVKVLSKLCLEFKTDDEEDGES